MHLIASMDRNGLIGRDGGLPWGRLPADLRRFRKLTMGSTCVVGRKTYETLPELRGRHLIVLSRGTYRLLPDDAIVIGGAEVYRLLLPYVTRAYLTVVDNVYEGDTHFPIAEFDSLPWRWQSERFDSGLRFLTLASGGDFSLADYLEKLK